MQHQRGFSLVELMVALLLGMVILAAILNAFLSNARTATTGDDLARIQEDTRLLVEIMGRDLRQAGGTACGNATDVTVSYLADVDDLAISNNSFRGLRANLDFPADRDETHDSLFVSMSSGQTLRVLSVNSSNRLQLTLEDDASFDAGELVIFCNGDTAQVTSVANSLNNNTNLVLTDPVQPSSGLLNRYRESGFYVNNTGQLIYLEQNRRAGFSANQILAAGVTGLTLRYLPEGSNEYVAENEVVNWNRVRAVEINLTLQQDSAGTNEPVIRTFSQVVMLRNAP